MSDNRPDRTAVEAAEAAHQRSVCDIPDGPTPEPLLKALARRVEVNLDAATDATVRRVGGGDPEVRGLEAPFRKGASRADKQEAERPKKRGRRRAAAKKKAVSQTGEATITPEGTE